MRAAANAARCAFASKACSATLRSATAACVRRRAAIFYQPLVSVGGARLTWTRVEPKHFQSSNFARRGFCPECGTPLTFEAPDGIALAIAAFDHPEEIPPTIQWGIEAKLPYVDTIPSLPGGVTEDDPESLPFVTSMVSYQHPDHDTETWPPENRS